MQRPDVAWDEWAEALPVWASADFLGQFTLVVMPFLLGSLVLELGFDLAQAGIVISTELGSIALTVFLLSPFMGSISRSKLAVGGALIAVSANLLSVPFYELADVAVIRGVAGLGYGMALAAGNAAVSNSVNPERLYDRKMTLFAAQVIALMIVIPWISARFGIDGFFVAMAIAAAIPIGLLIKLPTPVIATKDSRSAIRSRPESTDSAAARSKYHATFRRSFFGIAATAIIAAMAMFSLRESLAWGFAEIIGADIGVSTQVVGALLAVGAALGLLGPLLSNWARSRFGAPKAAVAAALLSGAATYHVVLAPTQIQFAIMVLLWQILYYCAVPLIMGIAAAMDDRGRVVAACSGALLAAYAAGPALAGILGMLGGKDALGGFIIVAAALSAGLIGVAVMRPNAKS